MPILQHIQLHSQTRIGLNQKLVTHYTRGQHLPAPPADEKWQTHQEAENVLPEYFRFYFSGTHISLSIMNVHVYL